MTQRHKGDVMVEYLNTSVFYYILLSDSKPSGYAEAMYLHLTPSGLFSVQVVGTIDVNGSGSGARRVWLTPEVEYPDPPEVRDMRDQMHAENCNSVLFNGPMGVCDCKRTESADIPAAPLEEL